MGYIDGDDDFDVDNDGGPSEYWWATWPCQVMLNGLREYCDVTWPWKNAVANFLKLNSERSSRSSGAVSVDAGQHRLRTESDRHPIGALIGARWPS